MNTKINDKIRLALAGENALMLYFSSTEITHNSVLVIDPSINADISNNVQQAVQLITQHMSADIIDLIPSYASILVMFDLQKSDHHQLRNKLSRLLLHCGEQVGNLADSQGKLVELPVYYSLESGQDLSRIAKKSQLSIEQVIRLHQAQEYRVYSIGFAPGFAYLGEVDARIAMPRLTTPRLTVPKGAVAIADRQTAVYPAQSPGGWNIIGLCPVDMFNPQAEHIMPVAVGDRVKFVAIDRQAYLTLGGELPSESRADGHK